MNRPTSKEDWLYVFGSGHWQAFRHLGVDISLIRNVASNWEKELSGIKKGWLCWNVDPDWCLVQQKLVQSVGWTPIVGSDPRANPPTVLNGSVYIDFNKELKLPSMWMHFPLEFSFMYCDRLAFWHSDLLLRKEKMAELAERFSEIDDGHAAAVQPYEGRLAFIPSKKRRYWELVGCNTRGSSLSQYNNGCGWWMNFWDHPSNSEIEKNKRLKYYYDHGSGIRYWHKKCKGKIYLIPESDVSEGHFTRIGNSNYRIVSPNTYRRNLKEDLNENFRLDEICRIMECQDFLE